LPSLYTSHWLDAISRPEEEQLAWVEAMSFVQGEYVFADGDGKTGTA
jgi:hypothetical protein